MALSRTLLLAALTTAATAGLLMLGAPQIASAAPAPGTNATTIARDGYAAKADPAAPAGAVADTTSPSGCVQRADYPHHSSHVPDSMNGVVTTTCRIYVPKISEAAQMWESRWWGWDRIGTRGSATVIDTRVKSVNASDGCKNNTVRVTGSGSVLDVDGRTYYTSTESIHVNNPCHL